MSAWRASCATVKLFVSARVAPAYLFAGRAHGLGGRAMLSLSMVSKVTATGFPFGSNLLLFAFGMARKATSLNLHGSYDRPWRIIFSSRLGHPDAPTVYEKSRTYFQRNGG